ncbi:MAG: hypothetical protein FD144_3547 [Rhodospirillaceae bacterium]|nr:MAG: hypothetical protein FD144_3547 [Rhodospirillaceae bacterium]
MTSPLAAVADGLRYAAMPTFAAMAVATAASGGGPAEALCGASVVNGMAVMYGLMSAFHAGPWLKLIANRRTGAQRPLEGGRI